MNRLQAVAHVGKGARHDDAHRIFEEARLHFLAEIGAAHDGALATVGAFHYLAVGARHFHHQRLRLHLLGDDGAAARSPAGTGILFLFFHVVQDVVFDGIFFGAVQQLVKAVVQIVVVFCH